MVVKAPDSVEEILSIGNVKIPCQCYYNARDNILTEIIQHSYNQLPNSELSSETKNIKKHSLERVKNSCEMKNVQTETQPQHCCVCEYYRNLETSQNKKELWNMQFNRWWGWNWKRKRKDFFSKFRIKCDKNCSCPASSKHQTTNLNNCNCNTSSQHQETSPKISSFESQDQQGQKNVLNIPELAEPLEPVPPVTTYGFKKPYTSQRKRNKHKQRSYEGWVREVTSSDSNNSIKSVKIKMESPKTPSNKEYMRYLSLRMRKLNSDESIDEDKVIYEVENKSKIKEPPEKIIHPADSKYISPITGKYYHLNFPEISVLATETNDTEYLKSVGVKDERFIPKPEYECMKYYNLMRQEHSELLKSICEVMCTSKMMEQLEKTQSEKEIKIIDYTQSKTSEIMNTLSNKNCLEMHNNASVNKGIKIIDYAQSKTSEIKNTLSNKNCLEIHNNASVNKVEKINQEKFLNLKSSEFKNTLSNKNYLEIYNNASVNKVEEMNQEQQLLNLKTSEIKNTFSNKNYLEIYNEASVNKVEEMNQEQQLLNLKTSEIKNTFSNTNYLEIHNNASVNKVEEMNQEQPFLNLKTGEIKNIFSNKNCLEIHNDASVNKREEMNQEQPFLNLKTSEIMSMNNTNCLEIHDNSSINKIEETQQEKPLLSFKESERKSSLSNTNYLKVQDNISRSKIEQTCTENPFQNMDLQKPNRHFDHRSENDVLKNSPFYDCLTNNITSLKIPNFKHAHPLLISKSSNLFYDDAVEHYLNNEIQEQVEEKFDIKDLNYDINYISNNLQSFASSISDTEFLICGTDASNINISEGMSEQLIGTVDLLKN